MSGGDSRQRRRFRRAVDARLSGMQHSQTGNSQPSANIEMPSKKPSRLFSTDRVLGIVAIAVGAALAFVGLTEMFPLYISISAYLLSLMLILFGIWKWEAVVSWRPGTKLAVIAVVAVIYCSLMAFPTHKQYERDYGIELIFKSPATWWQRQIVSFRLAEMRNYLRERGISVSAKVPPIEVDSHLAPGSWQVASPPNLPSYRGALLIDSLNNPEKITFLYAQHEIHQRVMPGITDSPMQGKLTLFYIEDAFVSYLNWSFWNRQGSGNITHWPAALWAVRERFGQEFTDDFVAQALVSITDTPQEGLDSPMDTYLCQKFKIGEGVRDSGFSRWPQVLDVLAKTEGKWVYSACK